MITHIYEKKRTIQYSLAFDCLLPEEAIKIMNALNDDDISDIIDDNMFECNLTYDVSRMERNGEMILTRTLVWFIEGSNYGDGDRDIYSKVLEQDRIGLEKIRDMILERTGLKEEES